MSTNEEQIINTLAKFSWNGDRISGLKPNTPLTITYSFLGGRPAYYSGEYGDAWLENARAVDDVNSFTSLSQTQKDIFNLAADAWAAVANITFVQSIGQIGDIAVTNIKMDPDELAITTSPNPKKAGVDGDIFLNSASSENTQLSPGKLGYETIFHELGHALGLDHPKNYGPNDIFPFLTEYADLAKTANTKYTTMVNYKDSFGGWWLPSKPMLYDILAIQYLYGVNPNTNAGDNIYQFKTGSLDAIQAIWDAGGIDEIDASNQSQSVTIDLRPGHFSFVGSSEDKSKSQIAIAFQIAGQEYNWIENATGTSKDDHLIGNDASNWLRGGGGNDTLEGGKKNDILEGGIGHDTYVWNTGDGTDTIIDADKDGVIKINGGDDQLLFVAAGAFVETAPGSGVWKQTMKDGSVLTLTHHSPWRLITADGSEIILGDDWQDGDFGIHAVSDAVPVTNLTLAGDLKPIDQNPSSDGIQLGFDSLGNLLVGGEADPGRQDTLYDSTGNDKLQGLAGDDTLKAERGGNDILEGGEGRDILDGGMGDDVLFAGEAIDVGAALNGGEYGGATTDGSYGDFMGGGAGDDTLVGSAQSDALMGGEGGDIVLGGAGNDFIFADATYLATNNLWTFGGLSQTYPIVDYFNQGMGNGVGLSPVLGLLDTGAGGDDVVYGGSGGDWVIGGRGNDVVYGESGNDALDGSAGDDMLFGGEGDDSLEGDLNTTVDQHGDDYLDLGGGQVLQFARGGGGNDIIIGGDTDDTIEGDVMISGHAADFHGNDYIDAKGGNDTVWGEGGSDTIYGGSGNDQLSGDATNIAIQYHGDDLLYGGDGNDILDGNGGNDTLDGGAGIDTLVGGAGDDLYLNVTGDDTINDTEGHNTIRLATGLGAAGLSVANYGPQNQYRRLDIALDNGETLKLEDAFYGSDATLVFANGSQMDLETLVGTQLNTALNLRLDNNGGKLYGGAAADQLFGGNGNDTVAGHKGNDTLQGGLGNDIYEFAVGDGQDTIIETGGTLDTLRFKEGISADNIKLTRYWGGGEDSLRLELRDANGFLTGDYVSVKNYFAGTNANNRVDYIEFADGTVWAYGDIQALILKPTEGNDTELGGFAGDDVIDGLGGNDSINGKAGNDWLKGGAGDDDLQGGLGNDILEGGEGNDRLLGYGVWLNDSTAVNNEAGNDVLDGGAGDDRLFGGNGADVYLFGRGDGSDYLSDDGSDGRIDTLRLKAGVLPEHVAIYENILVIDDSSTQIYFDGIERIEFDNGNGPVWLADDILAHTEFGSFNAMTGTPGDDTFVVDYAGDTIAEVAGGGVDTVLASRSYVLPANVENITLTGPLNINATGNSLDNVLICNAGNNVLDGKAGNDTGYGGLGNDVYKNIEHIVEYADEGIDTWMTIYGGTLPDNVENLSLNDDSGAYVSTKVSAIGNSLDNRLTSSGVGKTGDILDGRAGADTYIIKGFDKPIVYIDNVGDTIIGAPYEVRSYIDYALQEPSRYTSDNSYIPDSVANRLVLLGNTATNGWGNAIDNSIVGNSGDNVLMGFAGNDNLSDGAGNDYLDGGAGNDYLSGGAGNDTYIVDSIGDAIAEFNNQGNDAVESSISYTLGANLESLTLTGALAIEAIGNSQDNILTGNDANNTLQGNVGNDYLYGGDGDDVLYGGSVVDSTPATVINQLVVNAKATLLNDAVGAKMDVYIDGVLKTTFSVTNTQNYQAYTVDPALLGIGGHSIAVAFSNDAWIAGTPVQDRNLLVSSIVLNGAAIATNANGVYYDVGLGSAALDGNNLLAGNQGTLPWMPWNGALRFNLDGNDWLDGGTGADTMAGGLGNDTYIVDSIGDIVTESPNAGFDTVQSSIGYDLNNAANVENLILSGSAAINATGNTLSNILTGNAGNNRLDGGLGVDRMAGGLGNDTYLVDIAGDVVTESANSGIDTVESSVTLTLGSNLENLTLTGTAAINGTGNTLDNLLKGNSAGNSLSGVAGNDTLDGQGGTDTLTGGVGNDTYILGRGYGADTVVEADATAGNTDVAQFMAGVSANQLWFQHTGNNLEVDIIGTADKLLIKDWYSGSANRIEQFKITDGGLTLLDSQVENLVSAMAAFVPPAAGQTSLPADYQATLAPVLAANWK